MRVSEISSRLSGNHIVVLIIGFVVVFTALQERAAQDPPSAQTRTLNRNGERHEFAIDELKKVLHYAITKGGAACDTVTDFTVMKGGSTFYAATCSNGISQVVQVDPPAKFTYIAPPR